MHPQAVRRVLAAVTETRDVRDVRTDMPSAEEALDELYRHLGMKALPRTATVLGALMKALVTQSMTYRADYLIGIGMSLLPTLMLTFIWWSIQGARGGPERLVLLAYFLAAGLVEQVTDTGEFQWGLAGRIRNGGGRAGSAGRHSAGHRLVRGRQSGMRGGQIIAKSPGLVLLVAGLLLAGGWVSAGHLGYALLALCGAFVVRFLLSVAVSALSFWIDDVAGVYFTIQLAASVLSGRLIPLHVLGDRVEAVMALTPFYYLVFAPATLLAGGTPKHPVLLGQLVWSALLLAAAWALTRAGLRRYTNVAA